MQVESKQASSKNWREWSVTKDERTRKQANVNHFCLKASTKRWIRKGPCIWKPSRTAQLTQYNQAHGSYAAEPTNPLLYYWSVMKTSVLNMRFSPGRYSPDNTVTTGIASAADDTRHTLKVGRMYEAIKRSCKHHTIVYKELEHL